MKKFPEIKYSGKLPLMEISMTGKTEKRDSLNYETLAAGSEPTPEKEEEYLG